MDAKVVMLLGNRSFPAVWARAIRPNAIRDGYIYGYVSLHAIESVWHTGDGNHQPFQTMIKTLSGETWMVLESAKKKKIR